LSPRSARRQPAKNQARDPLGLASRPMADYRLQTRMVSIVVRFV